MASWIDKGSNITYTEAQISKRMEKLERQLFSQRREGILNRVQWGALLELRNPTDEEQDLIEQFYLKMTELEALAAEARSDNQFVKDRIAYEKAIARLSRYALSEGRPAVYEDRPTGEYDEEGNAITESVIVHEAVEPLPSQLEQAVVDPETGEQTGTEMVDNPAITKDEAERASAQAVIDATPQEVIDYVSV